MIDIERILGMMAEHEASDVYLTADSPAMFRIDGSVRPAGSRCLAAQDTETLALGLMSEAQKKEFEASNEQNLALYYPNLGRFRVNIFRQRGCVGLVVRMVKSKIKTIDDLCLPEILKNVALLNRGLVLLVGATGAGKSTTLAALVDYRNTHSAGHIVMIEDPIETVHAHKLSIVSQREIGTDTESYAIALKNALRQAPDVIVIGEIRDTETMEAAVAFAETGHLCIATLHSNNANQALERVLNFFPEMRHPQIYQQLSLNLRAVVSQRLIKAVDGGRVAAFEILLDSARAKDLIHQGKVAELKDVMAKSAPLGMQTFDDALFSLFAAGHITLEEALQNADSANNLRLRVKLAQQQDPSRAGGGGAAAPQTGPGTGFAKPASAAPLKIEL